MKKIIIKILKYLLNRLEVQPSKITVLNKNKIIKAFLKSDPLTNEEVNEASIKNHRNIKTFYKV